MADRTVSARFRADVTAYIAAMRAAAQATRQVNDEIRRARQQGDSFDDSEDGAQRLERALRRLLEAEQQQARQERQNSDQTRRNSEETRRNTDEVDRNRQSTDRSRQANERARDELGRFTRQTQESREQTDRARRSTDQARDSLGRFTRANQDSSESTSRFSREISASGELMHSTYGAAALLGAEVVSAGVAFTAFGAVAAPSILKVVGAQQDLQGQWGTLSRQQQISALQVRALSNEYEDLARSYEPQALSAFNTVITTARGLLPRLGQVVDATGGDIQHFADRLAAFVDERVGGEFLTWAGQTAPRALNLLGSGMTTAGDTALTLVQDFAPVGLSLLELSTGTLSAVNAIAQANPMLAQFAISALLLRAPVLGLVSGIGALSTRMTTYAAASRGASVATRAMNVVAAASPALYVAAAAGMLIWISRAGQAKSASQRLAESLRAEYRAVGNNITGYQGLINDIMPRFNSAVLNVNRSWKEVNSTNLVALKLGDENDRNFRKNAEAALALNAELNRARTAMNNVNIASGQLATRYGITRDQAVRLADAAGVDLSTSMDKSGNLTAQAAAKIRNYQYAAELAASPTRQIALALDDAGNEALQMKDRVTALTTAMESSFNPSIALFNSTTQLREGYSRLGEQISAAKGSMSGNSEASLQLRQAFAQQLQTVQQLATATFNQTHSLDASRAAVSQQLPLLYAMAGRSREARAQVDALARSLGINANQTYVSRTAFLNQAAAMGLSRARAEALWREYQKLTGATNTGSGSLSTYISRTRTAAEAARQQASRTDFGASRQQIYNSRVRESLPVLYALAGRNAGARAEVDKLARSTGNATGAANVSRQAFLRAADAMGVSKTRADQLWRAYNALPKQVNNAGASMTHFSERTHAAIHSLTGKDLDVTVYANGKFRHATTAGLASGGPVPAGWAMAGGGPTEDDVPIMASVGEHMWTAKEVDAAGGHGAVHRMRRAALRGEMKGYAVGGAITLRARTPSDARIRGVANRAGEEHQRFVAQRAVYEQAEDLATVWEKYAKTGAGSVVAAARSQIGLPYSWGGGGRGGPSYGIGRGSGTYGFDCSGLTEFAWWRGRRVSIGGVTDTQWAASSPSPRRPGALGFPSGPSVHVMLASDRPGYVIQAPYTGSFVQEVPRSVSMWRWPRGASTTAGLARGGPVTEEERRLGQRAIDARSGAAMIEAKALGLAGDPGGLGVPGYDTGGWVRGRPGRDTNLIAATAGEYLINRQAATASPRLVEAINSGRVRDGATGGVHVHLHNTGVIGSRLELQDWLTKSLDDLNRAGRAPWPSKN